MPRFSLRTFLIACVAGGALLGFKLREGRQPRFELMGFFATANGTDYSVEWLTRRDVFGRERLLCAIVNPSTLDTDYWGLKDLKLSPDGVLYLGQPLGQGMSKVYVALARHDLRMVPLSLEDVETLNAMPRRSLRNSLDKSSVWKNRVEPQIERLVALQRDRLANKGDGSHQ